MFVFTLHHPQDNICTMVNKYMFEIFFAEPDINDPKRTLKINGPHWSATRFVSEYVMMSYPDRTVSSRQFRKLVTTIFPDLIPFLQQQRSTKGSDLMPQSAVIDLVKFGDMMAFFTSVDWVALYHIASLEEKRQGRHFRWVF